MAGLIKHKQYDWKDSNLALFGSDLERKVKKESAGGEPAWKGIGHNVGLRIWRIVKFKVTEWPKQAYGKFFSGDSYIILNTYKEDGSDELLFDVHFWIGRYSTQDEYGTAAYKTVELDTFLDDKPIQHREVQGHESELFKSYFKTITLLEGGAESGFNKVKPEEYKPRLLHFKGDRRNVTVKEVPRVKKSLNSGDVFILDLGRMIYQWNGSGSNKDERMKAMQYLIELKSERAGKAQSETIEEDSTDQDHEFYANLNGTEEQCEKNHSPTSKEQELFRLSDSTGSMKFKLEKKGMVQLRDFDSKDVFVLDTKKDLIVWVGKDASQNEKKNALTYAHYYLMKSQTPFLPVTCVKEGKKCKLFNVALQA
ncbi:gelsolin-like protein 2 [Liolophura sinensis]|uniref:gelsolin-like protein 2 n=1 Tax=Liolophura sinensis TaxID=3198878 RepID=UPI0031591AFA